jgi:hypothetical protein
LEIIMTRYTLVVSAAVLSTLSFVAAADTKSQAEQQVALHTAMATQARASKDFGMAAHCAKLVRENRAIVVKSSPEAATATDRDTLALPAEQKADVHRAMLRTASFSRDPSMAAHCRSLIAQYTAEAASQHALANTSR